MIKQSFLALLLILASGLPLTAQAQQGIKGSSISAVKIGQNFTYAQILREFSEKGKLAILSDIIKGEEEVPRKTRWQEGVPAATQVAKLADETDRTVIKIGNL